MTALPSASPNARTFLNNRTINQALPRLAARYQAQPLGTLEIITRAQPTDEMDTQASVYEVMQEFAAHAYTPEQRAELAAADESEAPALPSEMDISIQYLLVHDWKMIDGVPHCMFIDPTNEDAVLYLEACERQAMRDTRDFMDETARERELNEAALAEDKGAEAMDTVAGFGPLTPPDDYRIFNRPQADGSYRPLSEFFKID